MSMFCTKNSVWAPSFDMRGRPYMHGLIIDEKSMLLVEFKGPISHQRL